VYAHILASVSALLPSKFQAFPGPGNFANTTLGLSRERGNPGDCTTMCSYASTPPTDEAGGNMSLRCQSACVCVRTCLGGDVL